MLLDTILILVELYSSNMLYLLSPPYSFTFRILPVIPKVEINVFKPATVPFCFNNKGKLW